MPVHHGVVGAHDDGDASAAAPRGSRASLARPSTASMDPASLRNELNAPPELALAELHSGACGLLYAPLQLHLVRRKRAQIALLQLEEAALRRELNRKFEALRKQKRECADRVAEHVARVAELQRILEAPGAPRYEADDAVEDVDAALEVTEGEVGVPRWLSPAQRCVPIALLKGLNSSSIDCDSWIACSARQLHDCSVEAHVAARRRPGPCEVCRATREREQAQEEAARFAGARNSATARALAAMMDSTLERKKAAAEHLLPREPWMSVPIKDMTAAQRQQLKEFERKAAELTDAAEAARRAAEGERKAAEEDAMAAIGAFNTALRELRLERMRADAALAIAEQQRLALACVLYQVRGLEIYLQSAVFCVIK